MLLKMLLTGIESLIDPEQKLSVHYPNLANVNNLSAAADMRKANGIRSGGQ